MNYGKKGVRAKQNALNAKAPKWGKKLAFTGVKVLLVGIIAAGIVGISAGIGAFKGIIASAPDIDVEDVAPVGFSTFVYDCEGNRIDKLVAPNSNRESVTMDKIPQHLADAFVAIEDARFYDHNGIDIKGIVRAGYTFIKTGFKRAEGASTITQQLLKNTIFTNWVNEDGLIEKLQRKFQEQYLALEITKKLSKEEILLRYMNTINLGQNTLGVQSAAKRYFNKDVSELTLSESAVIAAITQNPSKWNPISHPDKNAERRERVLTKMLEQGYISQADYDEAMADDVYSRIQEINVSIASDSVTSYFVDALTEDVYQDLINEAGYSATQASTMLYSGGLRIESTLDPSIQAMADAVFSDPENYPENTKWYLNYDLTVKTAAGDYVNYSKEKMMKWFKENKDKSFNLIFSSLDDAYAAIDTFKEAVLAEGDTEVSENYYLTPQPQVSFVCIDQLTGSVVAMIGGRGAKEGSRTLNRATDSERQPGSTFKVLSTYAPALDNAGMTLATVFNDAPFNYNNGTPVRNWYTTGYEGISSIRKGIYHSMNVLTVKCLTQITPKLGFDYLEDFGFSTLNELDDCYQPMALGGVGGVTNLELCAAYASIANSGYYNKPRLYTRVLDADGNVILDHRVPETRQVLKETTAFLLTSAMMDTMTIGTGKAANFSNSMSTAGKSGTTTLNKDSWFVGYTPYYTVSVWVGYDNSIEMTNKTEQGLAKKLWRAIMGEIHNDLPNQSFVTPAGIVQAAVCSKSGKLPIAGLCDVQGCVVTEYFDEDTVPTETCDIHYIGDVCAYSNLAASPECPFKIANSYLERPLIEDISLLAGSTVITENPDGTITTSAPATSNSCPHNAEFYADPNSSVIIEQQRAELQQRGLYFP